MNKTNTQQPTVEENTALSNVGKKIAAMEQRLGKIEKLVKREHREHIVNRLEDLCMILKNAVIELNSIFPPLRSFEKYLYMLTEEEDVRYIMNMIHECWLCVCPCYIVGQPEYDAYDFIDSVFYGYNEAEPDYILTSQERERDRLYHQFCDNFLGLNKRRQYDYKNYMADLNAICKVVCIKFDIKLTDYFTVIRSNEFALKSKLSRAQVERVFKVVVQTGKMNGETDTKKVFRSLFGHIRCEKEKQITWLDTTKSKKPNYASLYAMFNTMGVEMTEYNRLLICKHFTTPQGAIEPTQLKSRKSSGHLKQFEAQVKKALNLKP